jgi:catechol 2,3-dioxygenase-like lactoylglutathione lyase family enzyme
VTATLAQHGIEKGDTKEPLKTRVRMRGPENGGAKDGTPELYVSDPDGILMQIQDVSYCGGAGKMGEVCLPKPEPAPTKGLLAMEDISHFTIFVSESKRSFDFYQSVFAMPVSGHQGPTPLLGVGAGGPFLTIAGGGGGGRGPGPMPGINHASFRMRNFETEKVMKALESFGIKPRPSDARGPAGPMQSYITMRMPNRGGAPEGTAELYFTDPDGILLQIQDMSYCGGAGKMGEVCVP